MKPSEEPKNELGTKERIAEVIPDVIDAESEVDLLDLLTNTNLGFETDTDSGNLLICPVGASGEIRSQLQVELNYKNGEKEILDGREIVTGGAWEIPHEKAQLIKSVNLQIRSPK